MRKEYIVELDEQTRGGLQKMLNGGIWPARQLKHARILLLADSQQNQPPLTDVQIAEKAGCARNTVQRTRKRFSKGKVMAALNDQPRTGPSRRMLNTQQEQKVVAIACTTPPNGADHWTLELLVQATIAHKVVPSISDETIRQLLVRHDLKPWLKKNVVHSNTEC